MVVSLTNIRGILLPGIQQMLNGGNDINAVYENRPKKSKFVLPEPDFDLDEIHQAQELVVGATGRT